MIRIREHAYQWTVEDVADNGQVTLLRSFDNARDAAFYTYRQTLKQAAESLAIEAAKKIGACAWYDKMDKVMSDEDKREVRAIWDKMSGGSCWMDALFCWVNMTGPASVKGGSQ